jgi:hypothetical protein
MSRAHDTALAMIDSRFALLLNGDSSPQLHAETSMAIEMAYALGAIECAEHTYYVTRRNKIIEREHAELMEKLSRPK